MRNINGKELAKIADQVNIIDVRSRLEYVLGKKISNSKNIPMGSITSHPEKFLDKSKEYYIVCASGGRSMNVCQFLHAKGYKVKNVSGGMNAY